MADERPAETVMARWGETVIESLDDPEAYHSLLRKLDTPIRHVISSELLLWQVDNGGFWQYFFNSYGIGIRDAIEGLRAMGNVAYAQIAERALNRFGSIFPDARDDRIKALGGEDYQARSIDFDDLDSEFYALDPEYLGERYDILDAYAQRAMGTL